MADLTSEDIFQINSKIRWAAFSTETGQVKFCQMRPGVVSHTPNSVDRSFMELGPAIMAGVSERLSPTGTAGRVESIIINFEKDSVMISKVKGGFLAISADKPDALNAFQEISKSIEVM